MRLKILWLMLPLLLVVQTAWAASYVVKVSANTGGSVASPVLKGANVVQEGGSLSVTYTAAEGYYLGDVKVDKVPMEITDRESFTYEFTEVNRNHVIVAKFLRDPAVTVSYNAGGVVQEGRGKIFVPYSTAQTFSILPNEGYHIREVVVDKVPRGPVGEWTFDYVQEPHTLKAYFTINTYDITLQSGDGGTITPVMATAKHGQTKTFTIKPNTGMKIKSVTVNGEPVANLPSAGALKLPLTITGDTVIAAEFSDWVPTGEGRLKGTYHLTIRSSDLYDYGNGVSKGMDFNAVTATFNGTGGCTINFSETGYYEAWDNVRNALTVQADGTKGSAGSCSYTVDSAGQFTLNMTFGPDSEQVTGWVSTDGNVFVTGGASSEPDEDGTGYYTETISGVKAGASMTKASIAGTYHLTGLGSGFWKSDNGVSRSFSGDTITATFDGSGGCGVVVSGRSYSRNGDQTVQVDVEDMNISDCDYTVTSAGKLTLSMNGGSDTVSGWVSADGNVAVLGEAQTQQETGGTDYWMDHVFGVREGSSMDSSSLNGTYHMRGAEMNYSASQGGVGEGISGSNVTVAFDGAGGCTVNYQGTGYWIQQINQVESVATESWSGTPPCTYTVQSDGTFTLNVQGEDGPEAITGHMSADGNAIVVGGPTQRSEEWGQEYSAELMIGTRTQLPPE